MLRGWHLVGFYLQNRIKKYLLLILSIACIIGVIFGVMPNVNLDLINNNIKKDIEANIYFYSEFNIKKEWSK